MKHPYSLNAIIVCNDQWLICQYLAGWPGSSHDDWELKKVKLYLNPHWYFSHQEYLLGDCAFENDWFIVSIYRKPFGTTLPHRHEVFNDVEKPVWAISEHTIGILKGHFPWLCQICTIITDNPKSIKHILEYIDAAIILHNLLIKREDEIPKEWIDSDDFSDIDNDKRAPPNYLQEEIPAGAPEDEHHQRLMVYQNKHHAI